jgi:D-serine deaminase-like pyridoxal phosphate-dependent protein
MAMTLREKIEKSDLWKSVDTKALAMLDTPCLLVHGEVVVRNLARMSEYCKEHQLALRPHTKTHKSRRIAQLQLEQGATGLTVAKPGEAHEMSALKIELLLAYPPVTPASLRTIRELSANCNILVALDSLQSAENLASALDGASQKVGVLVDIDVGLHRTGVQSPAESLTIAKFVDHDSRLSLEGMFCYPGHVWQLPNEQSSALSEVEASLREHTVKWHQAGLDVKRVSGGSTPTAYQTHLAPRVTEIRPGTYVFNDMNTVRGGFCSLEDCAARFLTTVISTSVPDQIVIDAGSKTVASDRCIPAVDSGHGYVVEYPEARITHLSEEHGQVDLTQCEKRPKLGDRLTIIPNHVCPTVNLTDFAWWISSGGDVEKLPIDARGKVR